MPHANVGGCRLFAIIRCYKTTIRWLAAPLAILNVVRRGGTYHFRRAVPIELRARIGRREIVRSLGSCNAKTARLLSDQLYREWEHMIADNVRKALGANALHDGSWTAIEAARIQGLKWADLDI